MLDYTTLRIIWWALLGLLLIGFAIMDGFDLGAAAITPLVARNDLQRRIVMNALGPVWEGNQVWLILGAGALFAAWPSIYAVSFSGFYLAMFLVLSALIIRPVSFKFRSKNDGATWRRVWDSLFWFSGIVPCLVFGVAVGNVLQGAPFHFDDVLRAVYTGGFWALFTPFTLLCGVLSVSMLCMHGAAYLNMKTQGEVQHRARKTLWVFALLTLVLFALGGYWVAMDLPGYVITSKVLTAGPSNPMHKHVVMQIGAWIENYYVYHWALIAPMLGFIGALGAIFLSVLKFEKTAFISSCAAVFGVVSTVGVSMFPFILPSSTNPSQSLLVWDASSSELTLKIMLVATIIFLPIILLYTGWVYRVMRGKVTAESVNDDMQSY